MISGDFQFEQFADRARGMRYHDLIYLAEQEALRAWRIAHPSKGLSDEQRKKCLQYQQNLLGLIAYLRHGVVTQGFNGQIEELFRYIREDIGADSQPPE